MFCEIDIFHRRPPKQADLVTSLRNLGNPIPPDQACQHSQRYKSSGKAPIYAHEVQAGRYFVMLRGIHNDKSVFHLEGMGHPQPCQALLEMTEEYCRQLLNALNRDPLERNSIDAIRFFEDSGDQTGIIGRPVKPVTRSEFLKKQFTGRQIFSELMKFATIAVLLLFQLEKKDKIWAPAVSLGIVLIVIAIQALFHSPERRGRIEFTVQR